MGTTPVYGFPYQELGDPPNGPVLGQDLATAVESALQALDARKGYVADSVRTTTSANVTTTETVIQSLTFAASAGVRYKVTAVQSVQSTGTGESAVVRLRWAAGGTVTSGGAQVVSVIAPFYTATLGFLATLVGTFTPGITGSVTVGVSLIRNTGTGNISSFGNASQVNTILVEGV